ncbi:hypothetical protein GQ53DRAFT_826943 [Thozetella sp. PMI_491]|nr:hypothetical protein GQ53DRAFT_826943 [Thozetella sp. PMI_491]
MGLFKRKHKKSAVFDDPLVTYHITQSLSGKLAVKPDTSSYQGYSITIAKPKAIRDTIDVAVHRTAAPETVHVSSNDPDVVGHCLIQVVMGKFLDCTLGDGTEVKIARSGGIGSQSTYTLETRDGRHKDFRWMHDTTAVGGRTTPDRRLRLEDGEGRVVARFAGAETGISEFGLLEIYSESAARDIDWCGLLVLTGVCVYAREERNREKAKKLNNFAGFIGNWGGLLTMGIPVGGGSGS